MQEDLRELRFARGPFDGYVQHVHADTDVVEIACLPVNRAVLAVISDAKEVPDVDDVVTLAKYVLIEDTFYFTEYTPVPVDQQWEWEQWVRKVIEAWRKYREAMA